MDRPSLSRLAVGAILVIWRQRVRGLTQRQLEKDADLAIGSVSRFERGDGLPPPEAFQRIAKALDVPANELRWAAAGLYDHLHRVLRAEHETGSDGEAAFDSVPGIEIGGHSETSPLPGGLEYRWRRLQSDEAAVRRERDRLTIETTLWAVRAGRSEGGG